VQLSVMLKGVEHPVQITMPVTGTSAIISDAERL